MKRSQIQAHLLVIISVICVELKKDDDDDDKDEEASDMCPANQDLAVLTDREEPGIPNQS